MASFDPRNCETFTAPTNSKSYGVASVLIPYFVESSVPLTSYRTTLIILIAVAVIKYWGKKDVKLNTPLNSSVSVTLDQV
jgi:hypothetical protein